MDNLFNKNRSKKDNASDKSDSDENILNAIHNRHSELLSTTKAAVKRVMEEAATRKFIYFDNVTVNNLCGAIESCLMDGLQKRTMAVFEDGGTSSSSFALLKRVLRNIPNTSSEFELFSRLIKKVQLYHAQQIQFNSNGGSVHGYNSVVQSANYNNSGIGSSSKFIFDSIDSTNSSTSTGSVKSISALSFPGPLMSLFNKPKLCPIKHLWIKMALVDKNLVQVIEYLISKHKNYYEENSIMYNSLASRLFMDLIAGPCMLDYSVVKPSDHIWSEPDATELLDRHRIHSNVTWHNSQAHWNLKNGPAANSVSNLNHLSDDQFGGLNSSMSNRNSPGQYRRHNHHLINKSNSLKSIRPNLKIHGIRHTNSNNSSANLNSARSPQLSTGGSGTNIGLFNSKTLTNGPSAANTISNSSGVSNSTVAKEYVESLHQNMKSTLLYGKNNVLVQPKEYLDQMAGYLSLHQLSNERLRLKWTPNQLMNFENRTNQSKEETNESLTSTITNENTESYSNNANMPKVQWDCALSINMENIVYLHCHQRRDKESKITLVCQDGVQHPPIHFPPGSHLLQFLICLENGLSPNGFLDPPLVCINDEKTFPSQNRKRSSDSLLSFNVNQNSNTVSKETTVSTTPNDPQKRLSISSNESSSSFSFFNTLNKSFKLGSGRKSTPEVSTTTKPITTSPELGGDSPKSFIEVEVGETYQDENNSFDYVFKISYYSQDMSYINSSTESAYPGQHTALSSIEEPVVEDKTDLEECDQSCCSNHNKSINATSIDQLCCVMRKQILSRAFYGWLQYYRNLKTVRTKFVNLVLPGSVEIDTPFDASLGLTEDIWKQYLETKDMELSEIYRLIYFGGIDDKIRPVIWPRLLGHYPWNADQSEINKIDQYEELQYEKLLSQWRALEVIVIQRDNETTQAYINQNNNNSTNKSLLIRQNEITQENDDDADVINSKNNTLTYAECDMRPSQDLYSSDTTSCSEYKEGVETNKNKQHNSEDFVFTETQIVTMADNLHRIEKDVDRCDRNFSFFCTTKQNQSRAKTNLSKLRNIMISWVWSNLQVGYVQGMCDLLAPILVILQKESLVYACFCRLMKRMIHHFPLVGGTQMDDSLSTMALLLQITDPNLYEHMCSENEFTGLFVAYRWFLLDFKRELCYADVFVVWETIWSARKVASKHFNLFLALSMLQYYRDIILDNNMEYTDIIKFYNEMAEKHEVHRLLYIARDLIESIRDLLQTKQESI